MGKFDGVLLCTDFDQTYCHLGGIVHPDNLEQLAYFQAQGGVFTIASGRALSTFAPFLHLAPVNAPVILSNGAQVYDFTAGRLLMEDPLPPSAGEDLALLLQNHPQVGLELFRGDQVYVFRPNDYILRHHAMAKVRPIQLPLDQIPLPWHKALLEADRELLLPAQQELRARWEGRYDAIFSYDTMLEVVAKGCSKGARVLDLAALLGISRENIYCAGDNQNDISMLAVSALPFAPANATPEVRAFPGVHLLPECKDGAIAQLIRELDQRY